MRKFRFEPRLVPSIAALLGVALTLALGHWQLQRAAEKIALRDRLEQRANQAPVRITAEGADAEDVQFRRVEAHGRFMPQYLVMLDNKLHQGVAGYEVVMPLRLGDGPMHVLVDRGWVAGSGDRARLPQVATPAGLVTVTGTARVPSARFLELSSKTIEGNVWQNLVLERYRQATGLQIQPVVIEQDSPADDGLVRDWPQPDTGAARHQGYAFQWFCLAGLIIALYVGLNCKRDGR